MAGGAGQIRQPQVCRHPMPAHQFVRYHGRRAHPRRRPRRSRPLRPQPAKGQSDRSRSGRSSGCLSARGAAVSQGLAQPSSGPKAPRGPGLPPAYGPVASSARSVAFRCNASPHVGRCAVARKVPANMASQLPRAPLDQRSPEPSGPVSDLPSVVAGPQPSILGGFRGLADVLRLPLRPDLVYVAGEISWGTNEDSFDSDCVRLARCGTGEPSVSHHPDWPLWATAAARYVTRAKPVATAASRQTRSATKAPAAPAMSELRHAE